jgi:hypothetical protein
MEVLKMAVNAISCQQVAFRGTKAKSSDSKTHPIAAVASFILPGTGQIFTEEGSAGRGLVHLGIWEVLRVVKGSVGNKLARFGIMILALANRISSAINAYRPSAEEK